MKLRLLGVITLLGAGVLFADQAADAIMRASYALPAPETMESTAYMALVDANGSQSMRVLKMYSRKTAAGTDSFVEFLSPADVRGTKFLSIGSDSGEDDQRIWLPELGRVRKIASSGKGGKFMGSDLTYYDMGTHRFEDASYTLAGEEMLTVTKDGRKVQMVCSVIDSVPKNPEIPYSKTRIWVGKDDRFIYKSTMWDSKGREEKSVFIVEVRREGNLLIPVRTAVVTTEGRRTLLQLDDLSVNRPIDSAIFTVRNLER